MTDELAKSLDRQAKALAVGHAIIDLMMSHDLEFPWTIAVPGGTITIEFAPFVTKADPDNAS